MAHQNQNFTADDFVAALLNHFNYKDALWFAELACDELQTDKSAYTFAKVLYQSNNLHAARLFLEHRSKSCSSNSSNNNRCGRMQLLHAQTLSDLGQHCDAERILTFDRAFKPGSGAATESHVKELIKLYDAETVPHALTLLTKLSLRNGKSELSDAANQCLTRLNPLMRSSLEANAAAEALRSEVLLQYLNKLCCPANNNNNAKSSKTGKIQHSSETDAENIDSKTTKVLDRYAAYGRVVEALNRFDSETALTLLHNLQLPMNSSSSSSSAMYHYLLGRAYFIKTDHTRAIDEFEKCSALAPYNTRGMDIFSSALWQEEQQRKLAMLAKFMHAYHPTAPETHVVIANAFSLEKDHSMAIRMLRKAIQQRDDYYYAYYLLGHEYNAREQMDDERKALQCFQFAARLDQRSYYAWYGLGLVYYKHEQNDRAYMYFKRAYDICPTNPVLIVQLALATHLQHNSSEALQLLRAAAKAHPQHQTVKFQLAQILFSQCMYSEAKEVLLELQNISPRESLAYFLLGKVHEKLGETHKALMYFSRACELDPKGQNNQIKEALNKVCGGINEEESKTKRYAA